MKLSKAQAKAHNAACALLAKDHLTEDERWVVVENWNEGATHINSTAGAFFTPADLACEFSIEVSGRRIIDLCAGIGALSLAHYTRCIFGPKPEIVCVEKNPDYVAVGRKVLPEAAWICADVFDVPSLGLGRFDCAISNPPFGATNRHGRQAPRYTRAAFEYHVIDIAAEVADYGAFIIPQMSAPFEFSGRQSYEARRSDAYARFAEQTGIVLAPGCGIDTSCFQRDWRGVSPTVEVVIANFDEVPDQPAVNDLFQQAAE